MEKGGLGCARSTASESLRTLLTAQIQVGLDLRRVSLVHEGSTLRMIVKVRKQSF